MRALASTMRKSLIISPGAFRLLLAVAVILSHISRFEIGRLAVVMFFFLSGFWTTRIFETKFQATDRFAFLFSRILRVYPLYFICTLLVAAALGRNLSIAELALLGVATNKADVLGVSWSLDIELQFYLVLPLIIPFVQRRSTAAFLSSIAIAVLAWIIHDEIRAVTVLLYAPAFIAGSIAASTRWKPSEHVALGSLAAFALLSVPIMLSGLGNKLVPDSVNADVVALFWMAPLTPYLISSVNVRSSVVDRHLGNFTYVIYLVHFAVLQLLVPHNAITKLYAVSIAFAVAIFLYVVVDRPLDRLRIALTESGRHRRTDSAEQNAELLRSTRVSFIER